MHVTKHFDWLQRIVFVFTLKKITTHFVRLLSILLDCPVIFSGLVCELHCKPYVVLGDGCFVFSMSTCSSVTELHLRDEKKRTENTISYMVATSLT